MISTGTPGFGDKTSERAPGTLPCSCGLVDLRTEEHALFVLAVSLMSGLALGTQGDGVSHLRNGSILSFT